MQALTVWWDGLSGLSQMFYYCAIPATLILVIQTIATIMGLGGDSDMEMGTDMDAGGFDGDFDMDLDVDADVSGGFDVDADVSGVDAVESAASLKFFSVRGIVAFFSLFGWVGVVLADEGINKALVFIVAMICGFIGMLVIALLFYWITKMQCSGNLRINNAIGCVGQVYIPVPGERSGRGKIQATVQDQFREFYAMSEGNETLSTGTPVRVVDVIDENTLLIERDN